MSDRFDFFAVTLSVALIGFSSASLVVDRAYLNNPRAEPPLCRFYLCDLGNLVNRANTAALDPSKAAAQSAVEDFREALRRDMSFPYRWCDLGEASLRSGGIADAKYCFARAVELAPNSPPILIRAANFQFRTDVPSNALPYTSRILKLVGEYDPVIFLSYARAELPAGQVLREGLRDEPRAVKSYFAYLLANGTPAYAAEVWEWLQSRKLADDRLAASYIEFLLRKRRYKDARNAWANYLGPRRGPYPESNLLANGGFESEPSGSPLDWALQTIEHVEEKRDSTVSHSGSSSIRVTFDGAFNVDYHGASQLAVVSPGRYRFTAAVRTETLTTNQGIALRLYDPESAARLDARTDALTGTSEWVTLTREVTVGPGTNLIRIELYRQPSEKFDNKIAGKVWIDSIALAPVR